jgi:hypothetical protein
MTRRYGLLPLFVLFLVMMGCGKPGNAPPATVTGKVTYKGAPLTGGNMAFYPTSGEPKFASLDSAGTYEVGLPTGEVVVTIETESLAKKYDAAGYGRGRGGSKGMPMSPKPEGANSGAAPEVVHIPKKYADKDKSNLKFTATGGKQVKDWELTD